MIALLLGVSSAPAEAAPPLAWSAPAAFDSGATPSALACPSESLCVAVDRGGNALGTSDPLASTPTWSTAAIDPGQQLNAVSCAAAGPCVAVDGRGYAFVNPQPGVSGWSATPIDGGRALTGIACPTASLCVAVDEAGNALASTTPGAGGWTISSIDPAHHLRAVSCSSQSQCVAVDDAGNVLSSASPAGGASAWHRQQVDFGALTSMSCSAAGTCVAVDGSGDALVSGNASAAAATWQLTPIDGEPLSGVSCASSGVCVAVDGGGRALASDDPGASIPAWGESHVDSSALAGVSCLPGGFCMAIDTAGRSLSARAPAPTATTLAPTEVSSASATMAGAVAPNDATLGSCRFEYGTGVPYTQSIPCSTLPAANGGIQDVSAQLSGLSANTTYHYRVLASSPAGASAGADTTFTTSFSSQVALVYPHPSITGTPAPGQQLSCHAGTPSGVSVQLSYAWLRDLIPIPSATGSTYTVKNQDSGHHLQCQVTATDGGGSATSKSAFVTIPAGGAPASIGETSVGTAVFRNGRLSVPIACSPHAEGGCEIALRLTAVETLSGRRVVAVAARSQPHAHGSAAGLRHRAITLASVRAHLSAGAHATVTAALSRSAKRLLSSLRHLTAYASVSGTVIASIEAQLSRQLVALAVSSHRAATHAIRGR
jgi:hypothetical protein